MIGHWGLELGDKQWGSPSTQLVHMIMLVCEISLHILPCASLPKLKVVICVKNGFNDTQELPSFNMKDFIFDKIDFIEFNLHEIPAFCVLIYYPCGTIMGVV